MALQTPYEEMLEKYRDIDEDAILSSLTEEELLQLECEIDREVLNKIPTCSSIESESDHFTSSDEYSSDENDWTASCSSFSNRFPPLRVYQSSQTQKRQSETCLMSQQRVREEKLKDKSSESLSCANQKLKLQQDDDGTSKVSKRLHRRKSENYAKKRNHRHEKAELSRNPAKYIAREILCHRPKLKKVRTREPANVNEMLHGVSLTHITSSAKPTSYFKSNQSQAVKTGFSSDIGPDRQNDLFNEQSISLQSHLQSTNNKIKTLTTESAGAERYDVIGELSINSNNVEATIVNVWENNPTLKEINLNNIQNVNMEIFEELASAMECNSHVKQLNLANVGLTDKPARALATMLKRNNNLEKLNLESNYITGDAAHRLVLALKRNQSLTELKLDNQRHIFGAKVEHEFSTILKDNKTLLKFGYQFANAGLRMTTSKYLTRNMDDVRKKRVLEEKKRVQAGMSSTQPTMRKQLSSKSHRKAKAARAKRLKEQGISLDEQGVVRDEDVQKVLNQINPHEFAMLEDWFMSRLLGKTEDAAAKLRSEEPQFVDERDFRKTFFKQSFTETHGNELKRLSTPIPPTYNEKPSSTAPHFHKESDSDIDTRVADWDSKDSCNQSAKTLKKKTIPFRLENDKDVIKNQLHEKPVDAVENSSLLASSSEEEDVSNTEESSDDDDDELLHVTDDASDLAYNDETITSSDDEIERPWSPIPPYSSPQGSLIDNNESENHVQEKAIDIEQRITNTSDEALHLVVSNSENTLSNTEDLSIAVGTSFATSGDNESVISWKEGDVYDSDEYEIVEVEVSQSEESDSDEEEENDMDEEETPSSSIQEFVEKVIEEGEHRFRSESKIELRSRHLLNKERQCCLEAEPLKEDVSIDSEQNSNALKTRSVCLSACIPDQHLQSHPQAFSSVKHRNSFSASSK